MDDVDFAAQLLPAVQTPVDRAYDYIAGLIDLKQVPHGSLLPTAGELAKTIGVNRDAVLSALQLLQAQGLVRIGIGRAGVRVAEPLGANYDARVEWVWENRETIAQMVALRAIVDPGVLRLTAENGLTATQQKRARDLHEEMRGPVHHQEYLAADTEFHRLLAEASGKPVIVRLSLLVRRWVAPALDLIPRPAHRRGGSNDEHEELLTAIEAGDADRAEDVGRRHILATMERIRELLDGMEADNQTSPK